MLPVALFHASQPRIAVRGGTSHEPQGESVPDVADDITALILEAAKRAREETSADPEPELTTPLEWPVQCTVGPGLEGAIACESEVGYVNGSRGWLIYRGYDVFELAARSTYEEVSYLLLHGRLPNSAELADLKARLAEYRHTPGVIRQLMSFPIEQMSTMSALRMGTLLMRQAQTYRDRDGARLDIGAIGADEDAEPMETLRPGTEHAAFEITKPAAHRPVGVDVGLLDAEDEESCYCLLAGVASIAACVARVRAGHLPVEPDPDLSHAGNLVYMMTGRRPTPVEERVMDVALILHADHGMNASTFAAMVVASTLSDIYFAIGSGIAALNGPLHGGANEDALHMLQDIGSPEGAAPFYRAQREAGQKIVGFGHRVYKAYDPRARILKPLARYLAQDHPQTRRLFDTADHLEQEVVSTLGAQKGVFPNVDFYSGIVYNAMDIPSEMFTPVFAVARVAGWTARVFEYLERNRIFRPRAVYTGPFGREYVPLEERP